MAEHTTRGRHRGRAAIALASGALLAATLGACGTSNPDTHQDSNAESSARATKPSLHMISNGGHRLAFHVTPGRLPAIVLDAGGGKDSSQWRKVAPALAKHTGSKVITYDRAGMGKSDEVRGPWQARNAVSDLKAGLRKLGVTHDIVLVSHSLAGEIATHLVQDDADRISGAVLVDASLPEFYTDSETARIVAAKAPKIAALKKQKQTKQTRQVIALAANYGPAHRAYHKLSWPQDVPATAIVSSRTPFDTSEDARRWKQAQQEFVDEAPDNRRLVATDGSHDIPGEHPDIVLAAVEKMVKQVR